MNLSRYFFLFSTLIVFSSCLKSRYQLRNEPTETEDTEVAMNTPTSNHSGTAAINPTVDALKSEISRLSQEVQNLQNQWNEDRKTKSIQNEEIQTLKARLVEIEAELVKSAEEVKKESNANPSEVMDEAVNAFEDKSYQEAVDKLSEYMKLPKAKRLEEAYFLRAECYFQLKQYKKSIVDFSIIQDRFPKSKRVPPSLLKIAQSFEKMGQKSDSKAFYQELVDKFPKSPEAKRAAIKLR